MPGLPRVYSITDARLRAHPEEWQNGNLDFGLRATQKSKVNVPDCGLGRHTIQKIKDNPIRNPPCIEAPVAQREEARGSDPRQWGFESLPEYCLSFGAPKEKIDWDVAQVV